MTFSFRWTIENVSGHTKYTSLTDVVRTVEWMLEVRQISDGSIHIRRGQTILPDPSSDSFTDYLELSPEEILSWVWSIEGGKEQIEEQVKTELMEMLNPPETREIPFAMPWLSDCCPGTDPEKGLIGMSTDGTFPGTVVQEIR